MQVKFNFIKARTPELTERNHKYSLVILNLCRFNIRTDHDASPVTLMP